MITLKNCRGCGRVFPAYSFQDYCPDCRLRDRNKPAKLIRSSLFCEKCGTPIDEGNFCNTCLQQIMQKTFFNSKEKAKMHTSSLRNRTRANK